MPNAERVRHGWKFRVAEVVSATLVTPRMRRVVLHSPELADFRSDAFDDHIRLFFPSADAALPRPVRGTNGLVFPDGATKPPARDYTPRRFDPRAAQLTIDFVLHGEGPGSTWAAQARPGDTLGLAGPQNSMVVGDGFAWHLLIGDETALPAIGRRIEELPTGAKVLAFVEVASVEERQTFGTAAQTDIRWLQRDTAANPAALLADAVRDAVLPPGHGFTFIACENEAARAIRRHLVTERGFSPDLVRAYRFWQQGQPDLGQS